MTHRTPLLAATLVALSMSLACGRPQRVREPSPCDVPGVAETRDTVPVVREGASAGQVVVRARRQGSPEAVARTRARLTGNGAPLEGTTIAGDVPLLAFNGAGTFSNAGVFTKSAGAGIANINNLAFANTGIVNANAGDLQFIASSGTHTGAFNIASGAKLTFVSPQTLNAGAQVAGAGTCQRRLC